MRMVRVRLTSAPGAHVSAMGPELIQDLLWAHAVPDDGLEHIRVRCAPHGMDVVLFLSAPGDASALQAVDLLLERLRGPLARHGYTGLVA
ncbi:hypothetical protein [Streptomyces hydrogenans]|uniref:hypothetical protein n=1 Tax=Streptomyces hydrogenans TaxID=1873719 RepID=UPI003330CA44